MRKTTMTMSRPGQLFAIAVIMLLAPGIARALGVGDLNVYTALNEPLKAEIKFTSLTKKEFRTLDARLLTAPPHFNPPNLESVAPFLGIGITLVERDPGVYSLLLQSESPIREPFLRLLLEIEWAGGQLVREFTTLMDPRELRPPNEEGMPEFPSVPKIGSLGRGGSAESSRTGSKSLLTGLVEKTQKSTPDTQQPEVLTGQTTDASKPKTPVAQPPTVETTVAKPAKAAPPAQEPPEPTPPPQVSVETQRRLIQAEIENWAKERGLTIEQEPLETAISDAEPETLSDDEIATEATADELDTPAVIESPAVTTQPTEVSQGERAGRDFLMVIVGVVATLVLVVGGVLIRIYVLKRRALDDQVTREHETETQTEADAPAKVEYVDDDVEDLPEYGDRRSGYGRRQQFMSVEVERRQGPRRQGDQFAQASDQIDTTHANTVEESEVYVACGHDENAELLLKEALEKDPDRQDLKVKLLAIYQHRDDPEAFDALARQLYSNVDLKKAVDNISDRQTDKQRAGKDSETASDFDHSIEFDVPGDKPNDVKDQNDALDMDSPGDKHRVDADIFEREIEALAMTVPTDSDKGTADSDPAPTDESQDDAAMESLQVDDFAEIKQAVDRGVDLLESGGSSDQDDTSEPQSRDAAVDKPPRKAGKRSRKKNGKSEKSSAQKGEEQDERSAAQWKEPSTKIDLAKAYIAMGDAERARSILDEVLEDWDSGDDSKS